MTVNKAGIIVTKLLTVTRLYKLHGTLKWATSWQNQQNGICGQRRLRLAWASAQSDQNLRCPHEEKLGSLVTHWAHSEDWSDWMDAQADLSLCWVHIPFCWFCHEAAQMTLSFQTSHKNIIKEVFHEIEKRRDELQWVYFVLNVHCTSLSHQTFHIMCSW